MWVDDLDQKTEAAETVLFGLDGKNYNIDLSAENASKLRNALAQYITAARPAGASAGKPGVGTPTVKATPDAISKREQLDAIRAWARKQGYDVAEKGRIPVVIREAFEKSHPGRVSVV